MDYENQPDQGQMGSLGVLMSIGLFDVQGGAAVEPRYELTSPLFERATIQLDSRYYAGKTFTITAKGGGPKKALVLGPEPNRQERRYLIILVLSNQRISPCLTRTVHASPFLIAS